jgi:hypothetical protein
MKYIFIGNINLFAKFLAKCSGKIERQKDTERKQERLKEIK